jgi:hypothetical protein
MCSFGGGHNSRACVLFWMAPPSPPSFWIVSPIRRKTYRSAAGRPARKTAGLVVAAMSGIRSIREECALPVFTSGLQRSAAFLVAGGRRIRSGTRSNALTSGSKAHTVAKAETTGYARACRRAFDSQPRGRSGSAVWCPARRRCAQGIRFR